MADIRARPNKQRAISGNTSYELLHSRHRSQEDQAWNLAGRRSCGRPLRASASGPTIRLQPANFSEVRRGHGH